MVRFFSKVRSKPKPERKISTYFGRSDSGIAVNEETSITSASVYSCVKVISEDIAKLPINIFEIEGANRNPVRDNIFSLLNVSPNEESTAILFKQSLITSALLYGNGYAEIEFNRMGEPIGLWFLHPNLVTVERTKDNKLNYKVKDASNNYSEFNLKPKQIIHIPNVSLNGITGESVIGLARQGIGLNMAAERYAATFFGNSGMPKGILEHPENITEEAANRLRESWYKNYGGKNSNGIAVLEEGLTYKQISIPPEDAQFLETRQFQVTDVARWFRVPPHKIGDLSKATFSNIEQQAKEYVDDALMSWAVRFEQEIKKKLLPESQGAKINFNALLRGDAESRGNYYQTLLDRGVYSINEVRSLEDMNPAEGGDIRTIQQNMTTLDRILQGDVDENVN